MLRKFTYAVAILAGVSACPSRQVSQVKPDLNRESEIDIPVQVNRNIDILFVIDNSGSMGEEQTSLTNNFQRFINVLENIEGGLPNVHIGVVSSNMGVGPFTITACGGNGDNGRLLNVPRGSCQGPSGYWIEDTKVSDTERDKNYPENTTLAETFSCIAKLGTTGCGLEQHLGSMEAALDGRNPENNGFLRPDAYLAIIFLADEDDCSAVDSSVFDPSQTSVSDPLGPLSSFRCTEFGVSCDGENLQRSPKDYSVCEPRKDSYMQHPQYFVDFVKSLKDDPNQIVVGGIIGNATPFSVGEDMDGKPELLPSCETGAGKAAPGVRLKYFLDQFRNTTNVSICQEDLSDALMKVAALLRRVVGSPCLEIDLKGEEPDIDAAEPGIQLECQVSDVRYPGDAQQMESPIPRCKMVDETTPVPADGTNRPCWYVKQDIEHCSCPAPPGECRTPTNLSLSVDRNGMDPPSGTHIIAHCKTR